MQELSKKAVSQVIDVLSHSEKNIVDRIPKNFVNFLMENEDKSYIPNINYADEKWENTLEDDAKGLLALIYRDYIADKDERETLILLEKQEEIERRKKQEEKYDVKKIFKQNQKPTNERLQEEAIQEVQNALMVIKEEKWYERIVNKIKEFFGIRHK